MADAPAAAGGSGLKKQVAGQPLWLWAVGAGVVILGYLYFSHKASTSTAAPGSSSGSGHGKPGKDTTSINETIKDFQGSPAVPGKKVDADKDKKS